MFTIGTMAEMKNLITGVAHIGIRVFDLDRARRFYEEFPGGTSLFVRDPDRNVIEFHEGNPKI